MRKFIISFCFLTVALSLQATSLSGIRIESANEFFIVFIDGRQVSSPTTSCFVANLHSGRYRIEIYAANSFGPNDRLEKGKLLYSESIRYNGIGIEDIFIDKGDEMNNPTMVMNRRAFEEFFQMYKAKPFESDRMSLIETTQITSSFTSEQCKRLVNLYTFDSEKKKVMQKMYPRIANKENFFIVIDCLTFTSEKNEMNNFVKQYYYRGNKQ